MSKARRFSRWLLVLLVVSVLTIAAGGALIYVYQEKQALGEAETSLEAIATLKSEQIALWRAERLADAAVLSESPFFREAVGLWEDRPTAELTLRLSSTLESLQRNYDYYDVVLINADASAMLSVRGRQAALHADAADALKAAMETRRPFMTDLHKGPGDLPPHVDVIVPLFSDEDLTGRPLGAVVLRADAGEFLFPFIQAWPVPSRTAETLLVRRDGDSALFLNELRHREGTALDMRVPLSRSEVPAVAAVQGFTGILHGKDYRGEEVLSAVRPVPGSPWFIVAKEDASEILRGWRRESFLIISSLLGVAMALILAVSVVWLRSQKAHYRSLAISEAQRRKAEERYRATLTSIGDAVIATDAQLRVEIMNPVAEKMTGWKQHDALGKPLGEVFYIVDEQTRQAVERPAERVLREGATVTLADRTVLIARDGSERPIADSGAPIRDAAGIVTGLVLVFRDQTEEREARRRITQLSALVESSMDAIISKSPDGEITYWNKAAEDLFGYSSHEAVGRSISLLEPPAHGEESQEMLRRIVRDEAVQNVETVRRRKDGASLHVALTVSPILDSEGRLVGASTIARDITDRKLLEEEKERLKTELFHAQKLESVGRLAGGIAHDFNNMLHVIIANAEFALARAETDRAARKGLEQILAAAKRSANLTRQLLAFAQKQFARPEVLDLNAAVSGALSMLRRLIGESIELAWKPAPDLWHVKIDPGQVEQMMVNLVVNARDAIEGAGRITIETSNQILEGKLAPVHEGFTPGEFVSLTVSDTGCGMDSETQSHLFEPFYTTKGIGKGTGLGLASMHGIVMQNGGSIHVQSELKRDATFRVFLSRFAGAVEPSPGV